MKLASTNDLEDLETIIMHAGPVPGCDDSALAFVGKQFMSTADSEHVLEVRLEPGSSGMRRFGWTADFL